MRSLLPLIVVLAATPAHLVAQQATDLIRLQDEAAALERKYLQINTTNPPGNESRTMQLFAGLPRARWLSRSR